MLACCPEYHLYLFLCDVIPLWPEINPLCTKESIFLVAVVHHLLSMPRIFFYIISHKFNHPEKWFRAIMCTLIDNNLRWVWRESKQLAAFRGSVLSLHSTRELHRHLSLQLSGVSTLLTFMATHKIKSRGGGTPQNRVKVAFIDDLFGYDFFLIIRPYAWNHRFQCCVSYVFFYWVDIGHTCFFKRKHLNKSTMNSVSKICPVPWWYLELKVFLYFSYMFEILHACRENLTQLHFLWYACVLVWVPTT